MLAFLKTKKSKGTSFSDFIRHASSAEKKRVYREALKKATDRQLKVIEEARPTK